MTALNPTLQQAVEHYRRGRISDSEDLLRALLIDDPGNVEALRLCAQIVLQTSRPGEALELIDQALAHRPGMALAHLVRGNALVALDRKDQALASYRQATALNPAFVEAFSRRGALHLALRQPSDALAAFDSAIELDPNRHHLHNNRGTALKALGRAVEAVAAYETALSLHACFAEAHANIGAALNDDGRFDEAADHCLRALSLNPSLVVAHTNLGNALLGKRRFADALARYDISIKIDPAYAVAHCNRGNALSEQGEFGEAIESFNEAIRLDPLNAEAFNGRGNAMLASHQIELASADYQRAFALRPDFTFLVGKILFLKMQMGDWTNILANRDRLKTDIARGQVAHDPFLVTTLLGNNEEQQAAARLWIREKRVGAPSLPSIIPHCESGRIRIGYYSADFHNHATTSLATELFERHDRTRFEIFGFSFGQRAGDQGRKRASAAFDNFIDVHSESDRDIVLQSRKRKIDIAVDLKGLTKEARPLIFCMRAAPIQVNYLGYPGTSGITEMDYLIADETVIPEGHEVFYSEKIVRLPGSYQVNGRGKWVARANISRLDLGLPAEGFVFCCFNQSYKITPETFSVWMEILKRVNGSVLWLYQDNAAVADNLRREAVNRGVAPDQLVFAKPASFAAHLARQQQADLFLDTLPCGAHTTASDALWCGVPVVTQIGQTFAGRVAASLLAAVGLPELITSTANEFATLAVELAADPARMKTLRQDLTLRRDQCSLFDTEMFTTHLEAAFEAMHMRWRSGQAPSNIRFTSNSAVE